MVGSHSSVKGGITSVITQLLEYDWKSHGVSMKFIPTFSDKNNFFKLIFFAIAYLRILLNFIITKPDICHMHMSYKGSFHRKYILQRLCLYFKIKNIIHLHGSEFEKYYNNSNSKTKEKINRLLKDCNSLIVLGKEWEQAIKKIEPSTKIIVIENAIKIIPDMPKQQKDEFNILFLGMLIKRKGVNDLLNAFNSLDPNLAEEKNINLLIAGDGPEKNTLINCMEESVLQQRVHFLGWVDKEGKEELLKKASLFVLPSYNEGLPVAILEAMNYSLPIVSTNVGSIDEAVVENVNGYLINPGDIELLASSIKDIVTNEEKWFQFSQSSRNLCISKFDEKVMFDKLCKLYSGCLNESKY